MIGLTDSHAHLTSDEIYADIDAILQRAKKAHVENIINICTDKTTLERGLLLVEKYPWVHNVAATTPHDVEKEGEEVFPLMERIAKEKKLAAVGETGLDYHYTHSKKDIQQHFLRKYLSLALCCDLPIVIHCREAFDDLFSILDSDYKKDGKLAKGVLHCFTGTLKEAEQVIKRGWYLSLSGIVTFKKSEALREVAKIVPLDQLLIETDAPYLAPQSHRGKINEPSYIQETAEMIAKVKGIDVKEVIEQTTINAKNLFKI